MSDDNNPFGGMGDMGGLMQKAMAMQQQVKEAQTRAASRTAVGESGGGLVAVTANGHQEILKVVIDPTVVDPEDIDMLQDLVAAATNAALVNAKRLMADELGPLASMLDQSGLKL